ncbi:MAG: type II toxin-antitoxin system HicA family toxin [Candidatus Dadabacteria bacterium]|nr:type II toxin-antitoxin system HicA family toxin [Candidatus Dadabacteria bacterium]
MKPITGKRACELAESKGWEWKQVTGSHYIYVKEGRRFTLSIPVHGSKDLRPGLQRKIMKILEIEESDL